MDEEGSKTRPSSGLSSEEADLLANEKKKDKASIKKEKKELERRNDAINKMLREERRRLEQEVKLLLLGAGESGKSTIAKQMKIIHLDGFTPSELEEYKEIIFDNLIGNMKILIEGAKKLGIQLSEESEVKAKRVCQASASKVAKVAQDIEDLWKDEGIQKTYGQQNQFQLNDSASYYFDDIRRITSPTYQPTTQDVLRSRLRTTGIVETDFVIQGVPFRVLDMGGQRSERKKWLQCFEGVTAVIFCVALSEYNLKLREDETVNRMHESLELFGEICNSEWFVHTDMILFLNKRDLFEEKIRNVDLNECFPEYTGGKHYEKAVQFIREKFLKQNRQPKKKIYTHVTCATDTSNIAAVFNAVKDIILRETLDEIGMGIQ